MTSILLNAGRRGGFQFFPCHSNRRGRLHRAAKVFGICLFLLDWYFLTVPVLEKLKCLNHKEVIRVEIIPKAKKSCTAFEKLTPRKTGRGQPLKNGPAIHLKELFISFQETQITIWEIGKHTLLQHGAALGAKTIPRAAVCAGGNRRSPKHSSKYQPGTGTVGNHQAL